MVRLAYALLVAALVLVPGVRSAYGEAEAGPRGVASSSAFSPSSSGDVFLSDEEGLALAAGLLGKGEKEAAVQVYSLLLQSRRQEICTEAAFMLSQLAVADAQYNRAIGLLTGILNRFPDLARVRLELARAYFLNENWDDARFHFELVKGGKDIPPGVIASVDLFLQEIRRKKNWSLEVGFGYVPDSNLNQVSGNTEECVSTSLGLLCRELEDKKSGHGARLNATGNHYWKFSKGFGIRSTAGVSLTGYGESEYNDYILSVASGPRLLFGKSEISLQPTYTRRIYGEASYSESHGLRFDMQNDCGRLIFASGASFNKNSYAADRIHAALKGQEYRAYVIPRVILTNRSFAQAGLEYTRDETENGVYGSDRLRYSVGGYYFFQHGFSLFAEASLTRADYHKSQWYVTEDHRIDKTRRQDWLTGLTVELGTNIWEEKGIRPTIQYSYLKRDSNIWSHDYDRHRVNLLLTFRF